jgi:hypothetical protein
MAGRGSRSQGVPRATVFLTSGSKSTADWIKNLYEAYPRLFSICEDMDKGEKLVKQAKTFRSRVIKALDKGRWLTNDLKDTSDVLKWLEGAKSPYYDIQE